MTPQSRLLLGRPDDAFATGRCKCTSRPALIGDTHNRLVVPIAVGNIPLEAVIDTGGSFLILEQDLGDSLGLDPKEALDAQAILVRGTLYRGSLHRVDITLVADQGDSLTFQATTLILDHSDNAPWRLPTYLGWYGCLERLRVAIDPDAGEFFFGQS
jgi:hypothetical protein